MYKHDASEKTSVILAFFDAAIPASQCQATPVAVHVRILNVLLTQSWPFLQWPVICSRRAFSQRNEGAGERGKERRNPVIITT